MGSSFVSFALYLEVPTSENSRSVNIEVMDVKRLLELALASKDGYEKAKKVYASKYSNTWVAIVNTTVPHSISLKYDMAEIFLRAFGAYIRMLLIEYKDMSEDKHKKITKLVSDYCSDTLIELCVQTCGDGAFNDIQKPFKNVKRVFFFGDWTDSVQNSWKFNNLFPGIRALDLYYPSDEIYKFHYKHLISLNIYRPTPKNFVSFIEKNPQIQLLELQATSLESLKTISETLNKLRILAFSMPNGLDYKGPVIHFKSIERLIIYGFEHEINWKYVTFKEVDELKLDILRNIGDGYVDLIGGINELNSLIIKNGNVTTATLSKLSENLSNYCKYVDIEFDTSTDAESICNFLKSNKQIRTFDLDCPGSEIFLEELKNCLYDGWKISNTEMDYTNMNVSIQIKKIVHTRNSTAIANSRSLNDAQSADDSESMYDSQDANDSQYTDDSQITDDSQYTDDAQSVDGTQSTNDLHIRGDLKTREDPRLMNDSQITNGSLSTNSSLSTNDTLNANVSQCTSLNVNTHNTVNTLNSNIDNGASNIYLNIILVGTIITIISTVFPI